MMNNKNDIKEITENVRKACIQVAREGFQDAAISGLCTEGAAEAAISAIQKLDLNNLINESTSIEG